MKIAVTGTRGIPHILGGVETHCEELFPRIAGKGFDVSVIRRKSYTNDHLPEYKGVRLVDLTTPRKKAFEAIVHTIKAVGYAKYKLHADMVHIHAVGPALVTPFARLLGLKVVFTHHGPDYERDKWGKTARFMLRLGERMGVVFANEVIVISNVINELIIKKYKRKNAHLIYNGVPEPEFFTDSDYLDSLKIEPGKYIFAMGRFVPEKNFHQLIQAFASLKDKKDYRLVLAGDADFEDDYSGKLKELAHENGVVLTGFVKGTPLQTLLTHAKIFVLPSSHEGLPISLLEAMSYRLPVIASNIPANLEIGLPEESYFETGNCTELADKLQEYIRRDMQKIEYPMDKYNWDTIAGQTIEIYKSL
jgi:glycosyltransferase involved in cell wall biosynthesis